VLAQLLARTNVKIAPSIALNAIVLLIKLFILRLSLYSSTTFLYLRHPLLLKIQFLWMIPLLNLLLFTSMATNIIIFLHTLPRQFKM
jgi:hypothetical protein